MLETFQNFEQTAGQLSPVILTVPGIILVLAGLFVWLGGLGFRKVMVVIIGAVAGGACGFFMTGANIILTTFSACAGTVVAIIFEKVFITIMAVCLAVALGFAVLAGAYIESPYPGQAVQVQDGTEPVGVKQSLEIIEAYTANFFGGIKWACREVPAYGWAVMTMLAVLFGLSGFFLWRLTSVLYCSAFGTVLVFGGMVLLLLYKGAEPISRIGANGSFYGGIFAAMTGFGTIEQLLLCAGAGKKEKKEADKDKEDKE